MRGVLHALSSLRDELLWKVHSTFIPLDIHGRSGCGFNDKAQAHDAPNFADVHLVWGTEPQNSITIKRLKICWVSQFGNRPGPIQSF